MKRYGGLFVISAPSGAGKSTLCRRLLKRHKQIRFSISVTTRHPRPGEVDGKDYFFVSEPAFQVMRKQKALAEWATVHGQFYGTPKSFLNDQRQKGMDVLLDIDVQGALQVKKQFPEAVLIFIRTPKFEDLKKRLLARRSESLAEVNRRLADAKEELKYVPQYDYCVVNDQLAQASRELEAIFLAESLRMHRQLAVKHVRR